ncbi:MAG: DUF1330 domain-containing protein [Gammaproteobacteria bacterium]|jgi:uncharacterized protein (DUF1330 family)|nr:hypothetical protein [Chromatiales bacterium]MDP6150144.1 DUF1330 domain-containing protein [Gammaproteobacteria bacterium]MDP7094162.1 DUF1330 domain-containing protein [Gammaproteobacteria bacterium]MDP7270901.1 DUF1330 domain-containing protein [Gammaproteobacteria bacterium]MDP7418272.1 DUF1330 domain-containing protein [Gammaproteobacteria bacterium]
MAAYLLAVCEVTNRTEELKEYQVKSAELIAKYGGKYVIRGPSAENIEGDGLQGKFVVLSKWQSIDDVHAFVNGDEYQNNVKHLRDGTGNYHIAIYEGA